jgi:phosphoenolpyruvate-protein phosphotransferase (PTS system enzyme I)
MTAQAALHRLMAEYTQLFSRTKDEYLRDRLNDIRDVVVRISAHLSDVLKPETHALPGPLIVVADELLPSHVVALGDADVHGIVTQAGSQTSHAAIIARSRGIPAVSGVRGILRQVKTGDTIIVDGREGHVTVNPDAETRPPITSWSGSSSTSRTSSPRTAISRPSPPTAWSVELLANINGVADAFAAERMGATGVGLFRTEYMYLTHPDVPDEEEQLDAYRRVIDACPGREIVIRTLDIGGDKTMVYLGRNFREANPFMGWRSIRLSFEHPEFFNTQIRADPACGRLREAKRGPRADPVPMITTLEELRRLRTIVRKACKQLSEAGKPHVRPPVGMMLEVPAAALTIRDMLEACDYVSVGSNDLVQYLMAADRDNPKVSHLCQPLAPAVLRVLADVIRACNEAGTPITVCGEMAGQPRSFVLLLGHGPAEFQHELGVHSHHQRRGRARLHHAGRATRPAGEGVQDHRSGEALRRQPAPPRSAESRAAGHCVMGSRRSCHCLTAAAPAVDLAQKLDRPPASSARPPHYCWADDAPLRRRQRELSANGGRWAAPAPLQSADR